MMYNLNARWTYLRRVLNSITLPNAPAGFRQVFDTNFIGILAPLTVVFRSHARKAAFAIPGRRVLGCLLLGSWFSVVAPSSSALAHPHVWVTMKSELVYAADGSITGIRHVWTFDDMFSTYALQGIEHEKGRAFTREELAPLAETNVTSLKEYDYFNYARVNGKKQKGVFTDPVDYWLDYTDSILTLHFTLPLKTPIRAHNLEVDVYDPEFFIDFEFAENDPVSLADAPAQCSLTTMKPTDMNFPSSQRLNKVYQASEANAGMGSHFANKIFVACP
jgi:ABC-type uncharacterized transport system substrate-binding protein